MQKIDGVDLSGLIDEVAEDRRKELIAEARKQISGIVLNLAQWANQSKDLEKQKKKIDEKIEKAQGRLKKIREGDWNALTEPQDQKKEAQPAEG